MATINLCEISYFITRKGNFFYNGYTLPIQILFFPGQAAFYVNSLIGL